MLFLKFKKNNYEFSDLIYFYFCLLKKNNIEENFKKSHLFLLMKENKNKENWKKSQYAENPDEKNPTKISIKYLITESFKKKIQPSHEKNSYTLPQV